MCLKAETSFSKDDEFSVSFGLSLHTFDEIGCLTFTSSQFHYQGPCAAINLRKHAISKHEVCEDG